MSYEQCTFSPESGADSLPTSSSDTGQLSLLSGMDTPARSYGNAPQTDGSPACQCGRGTLDCSTHPSTPEAWTSFMRASLARILASPETKRGLALKHEAACTAKSSESLASFDPDTCSLRTSQQSLLTDSPPSSLTLPRSGLMRNGCVSELPIVGRRTTGTDGFCWPTVSTRGFVNDGDLIGLARMTDSFEEFSQMAYRAAASKKARHWPTPRANKIGGYSSAGYRPTLEQAVKYWPTPTARIHKGGQQMTRKDGKSRMDMLDWAVEKDGGRLNPSWVEWLMGFPIGFTDSKDWATRKCRSKPQPPGDSLGDRSAKVG